MYIFYKVRGKTNCIIIATIKFVLSNNQDWRHCFRLSDFGVEINRLLERCLKESRCIDTESLCIVAGEKVIMLYFEINKSLALFLDV